MAGDAFSKKETDSAIEKEKIRMTNQEYSTLPEILIEPTDKTANVHVPCKECTYGHELVKGWTGYVGYYCTLRKEIVYNPKCSSFEPYNDKESFMDYARRKKSFSCK